MMLIRFILVVGLICIGHLMIGQSLYSLNTQDDDAIQQWDVIVDGGDTEGEIVMTWRLRNDITQWSYNIDGKRGTIKQKWENNTDVWELRSGSTIVKISTLWSGEYGNFIVSDGTQQIKIERKYMRGDPIEWNIKGEQEDLFFWYNEFDNDRRDWIIEDNLSEEYSLELKLAAVFVSVLFSLN